MHVGLIVLQLLLMQMSLYKSYHIDNLDTMHDITCGQLGLVRVELLECLSPYEIITSSNFRSAQFARVYCNLHKLH